MMMPAVAHPTNADRIDAAIARIRFYLTLTRSDFAVRLTLYQSSWNIDRTVALLNDPNYEPKL